MIFQTIRQRMFTGWISKVSIIAVALTIPVLVSHVQVTRWYYKLFSSQTVQIGPENFVLPSTYFLMTESKRPNQFLIGGFYDANIALPTESYLFVEKHQDISKFTIEAIAKNCVSKCTSFARRSLGGMVCGEMESKAGWEQPSQILNIFCTFPEIRTVISYHGTKEHYPYFDGLLETLAALAREQTMSVR